MLSWTLDATNIGLTLQTITVASVSRAANNPRVTTTETMIIGFVAACVSRSVWPLIGPILYIYGDRTLSQAMERDTQ